MLITQAVGITFNFAGKTFQNHGTEQVIHIHNCFTQQLAGKQLQFFFTIGLHGTVVIKVIACQVGKQCRVEFIDTHPALFQSMRRYFHNHGICLLLQHFTENSLHSNRVRCRSGAVF